MPNAERGRLFVPRAALATPAAYGMAKTALASPRMHPRARPGLRNSGGRSTQTQSGRSVCVPPRCGKAGSLSRCSLSGGTRSIGAGGVCVGQRLSGARPPKGLAWPRGSVVAMGDQEYISHTKNMSIWQYGPCAAICGTCVKTSGHANGRASLYRYDSDPRWAFRSRSARRGL